MRDGKKELYNLKNDIGENNDLAQSNARIVNELFELLSKKLKENKAPMMVKK
jgi:hypothetical protein